MLNNGKAGRIREFGNKLHCGIYIAQIIIGKFLSLNLLVKRFPRRKEVSFLMRIFAVTKRFRRSQSVGVEIGCGLIACIKIAAYCLVVCSDMHQSTSRHAASILKGEYPIGCYQCLAERFYLSA